MACYSSQIRTLGIWSAALVVALQFAYGATLVGGLLALSTPEQQIPDPYFTIMEVLILCLISPLVALFVALHLSAPEDRRAFSLLALIFIIPVVSLTGCVHFLVLTLSRLPQFADQPLAFSFTWPSVIYAIDILAWDMFFAIAVLFAALIFPGPGLNTLIRVLLIVSGMLALAGLLGVGAGSMQLRNIGILGYAVVFPVAVFTIAVRFLRHAPAND